MAGDWIKMRTNLWDDPRIARLCDLTDQGEAAVIGGLYWLWAMADEHTEDGLLPGMTCKAIDRKTGVSGLGAALCAVGWLEDSAEGVRILGFEEHNGASAKKRATTAKRVASHRGNADVTPEEESGNAHVTLPALQNEHASVTPALAREEKRREESNTSSSLRSDEGAKPRASKRCPADFQVTKELREWAEAECPGVDLMRETASFRDYTFAKAYSDWPATWRNWIRRSFGHTAQARASPRKPSKHTGFEQMDYTAGVNADGTLA